MLQAGVWGNVINHVVLVSFFWMFVVSVMKKPVLHWWKLVMIFLWNKML